MRTTSISDEEDAVQRSTPIDDNASLTDSWMVAGSVADEIRETGMNRSTTNTPILSTKRPAYNQEQFDKHYVYLKPPHSPWGGCKRAVQRTWRTVRSLCSLTYFLLWFVLEHFPMIDWVRHYQVKTTLPKDVLAGITAGVLQIPQGLAYGLLSAAGPIAGLYTAFVPCIVYSAFASSRHVSVGAFAVISMVTATVIRPNTQATKQLLLQRASITRTVLPGTALAGSAAAMAASIVKNSTMAAVHHGDHHDDDDDDHHGDGDHHGVASTTAAAIAMAHNASGLALTIIDDAVYTQYTIIQLSTAICLVCGIVLLALGVLRLGFISCYLSDSLIAGLCAGAAVHIITTQLFHMLGYHSHNPSGWLTLYYSYYQLFEDIHETNLYNFGFTVICMAILLVTKIYINGNPRVLKKLYNIPVPIELLLVIVTTVLSYVFNFPAKPLEIGAVGKIPVGLPAPSLPDISLAMQLFGQSIIVAFVILALTISLGRVLAKKNDTPLDPSTELRALGLCNIAGAFFQCVPAGNAMSRTMILAEIGAPTQLTNLIGCVIVFVVLQWCGPLFEPLPDAVLAAIVMVAMKPLLMTLTECRRLLHVSWVDAVLGPLLHGAVQEEQIMLTLLEAQPRQLATAADEEVTHAP